MTPREQIGSFGRGLRKRTFMTQIQIDPNSTSGDADVKADPAMGTTALPGREALDRAALMRLSEKSDAAGLVRLAGHLAAIAAGAAAVYLAGENWWLKLPAMVLLGFTLTTLFAPMHECVHATPFASRRLNRLVGWFTGAAVGWNFTYYRRFHAWHHRYTQDPENDPELATPKPDGLWAYAKRLSGIPYYVMQAHALFQCATGRVGQAAYIPARGVSEIQSSAWAQIGLYGGIATVSLAFQSWAAVIYWALPMLMAQPLMRIILLAEHTGCSEDRNGLTNTRTTLTNPLVRFLMWNMPFHAEHHLYPSVPFYKLPEAHAAIRARLAVVSGGYPAAHREIRADMRGEALFPENAHGR